MTSVLKLKKLFKNQDKRQYIFIALILVFIFYHKLSQLDSYNFNGETMGTTWKVILISDDSSLGKDIDQVFRTIDRDMSTYKQTSLLNKINSLPIDSIIEINDDMLNVLRESLRICNLTGGAFNISVGRSVGAWGFGPKANETSDKVKLLNNRHRHTCNSYKLYKGGLKKINNIHLDLSAIAKGYAIDKVANLLDDNRIDNYFIELGGEVRFKGKNLNKPWSVGITNPSKIGEPIFILDSSDLNDISLATSGNYLNYKRINGNFYSHTINPKTNLPIGERPTLSVSVFHNSAMTADALATALNVMGFSEGISFANTNSIKALFLYQNSSKIEMLASDQIAEILK